MSNFWDHRRVLVTGAGGFIASHLVENLVCQGAQVRAFVRYNSRADPGLLSLLSREVYEKIEIVAGDIRDKSAIQQAVTGCSHIFHLGALIAIPYSYKRPSEVVESNILGTLNVLLAAQSAGIDRLVHTSTSEVYGTARYVPIDESHPLQGQSPYSASKIGADKLAESFYCSFNIPVVTVRPFNTYGPIQSMRAVIPTIIAQALTGNVVRLGNLNTRRDLTFVSDTVAGFLKAGEAPGVEGGTFNLGTGSEAQIEELAREIISLIGKPIEIVVDETRLRPEKSEVLRLLSDNRLAKEVLGWEPTIPLRKGLAQTISWMMEHPDLFQPDVYQL